MTRRSIWPFTVAAACAFIALALIGCSSPASPKGASEQAGAADPTWERSVTASLEDVLQTPDIAVTSLETFEETSMTVVAFSLPETSAIDPVDPLRVLGVLARSGRSGSVQSVFEALQQDGTVDVTSFSWELNGRFTRSEGRLTHPGAMGTVYETGALDDVTLAFVQEVLSGRVAAPDLDRTP